MTDARVALPPGIYNVRSSESTPRGVVDPSSDGGNLFVTTASSSSLDQQWLISGDGTIKALDSKAYGYATTPSVVNALVTRNVNSLGWIINVKRNANATLTGYIMSNDGNKNYWGLNGNNLQLQNSSYDWTFIAV